MKGEFLTNDGRKLELFSERDYFLYNNKPQLMYYCVFRISPNTIFTESCKLNTGDNSVALFKVELDAYNYGIEHLKEKYGIQLKDKL